MHVIQSVWVINVISVSLCFCSYPFQNVSLPWDDRVNDLVDRLTLLEIQDQLAKGGAGTKGGPAPAIPRLGIGPYQWNEECLRGIPIAGEATSFPQAIGLAATFRYNFVVRLKKIQNTFMLLI